MRVNFTISNSNITLFYKGVLYNIPETYPRFQELKEHLKLKDHDTDFIETIVNVPAVITRISGGDIKVVKNKVYYKDNAVHDTLSRKLIDLLDEGFDVTPWINFANLIYANPSQTARESLFDFLEKYNAPITEDGHFIAFKRIRPDFMDIHSGTFDNSPGKIIEMPREEVTEDRNITCSYGLHVAASSYLDHFSDVNNSKTISVKVSPYDVVSVPSDYGNSKMRVCKYEVLDELEIGDIAKIEDTVVYTQPYDLSDYYPEDEKEFVYDEYYSADEDYIAVNLNESYDDEYEHVFTRQGENYTGSEILKGIKDIGSVSGWAKSKNIPKSTVSDWVKKIKGA